MNWCHSPEGHFRRPSWGPPRAFARPLVGSELKDCLSAYYVTHSKPKLCPGGDLWRGGGRNGCEGSRGPGRVHGCGWRGQRGLYGPWGGSGGIGPRRGSRVMRLDGQPLPTGRDGGGARGAMYPMFWPFCPPPGAPSGGNHVPKMALPKDYGGLKDTLHTFNLRIPILLPHEGLMRP